MRAHPDKHSTSNSIRYKEEKVNTVHSLEQVTMAVKSRIRGWQNSVLGRWVAVSWLSAWRRPIAVLLWLIRVSVSGLSHLWLELTVLVCLPLAYVAVVEVLALQWDQRDPTQLEPSS